MSEAHGGYTKRILQWDQRQITGWATEQFGYHGPLSIAIRGNKEMSELLSSLANDADGRKAAEQAEECADVAIFLLQICERLGYDLLGMVDHKMNINANRTWTIGKDGSHQHVEQEEVDPKTKSVPHKNGHILWGLREKGAPEVVAIGGLGVCKTCGAGEIELDEPCTGGK